jgi:hypothetical protein
MEQQREMRRRSPVRLTAVIAVIAALLVMLTPMVAGAAGWFEGWATVPNPKVTGPITGGIHGYPFGRYPYDDLGSRFGYMEQEYFIAGTAYSDGVPGPNEYSNGKLKGYAPYETRILVTRPIDQKRFNGTVVVEWLNTSTGMDGAPDWGWAHTMLMNEGYAFAAVSAQNNWQASETAAGVTVKKDGLGPFALKNWDPVRYAPLSHPGDEFAATIFSQAVQAIRHPVGIAPLGGLHPRYVLAAGESQSADRVGTYIERDQASAGLTDGFLIEDDQRGTPGYGTFPIQNPGGTKILNLRSEAFPPSPSPTSSQNYRRWEVAGTPHIDHWTVAWSEYGSNPLGTPRGSAADESRAASQAGDYGERADATSLACGDQFPLRYAVDAAIAALNTWIRTGRPGPSAPPMKTVTGPNGRIQLARDAYGNVIGGYRLPPIAVPVATYMGSTCSVLGITVPFDSARLSQLYPTHEDYVQKMQRATDASVANGWLLPADAKDLMRRASTSSIPQPMPNWPLVLRPAALG